jgi:hypothetical protein
VEPSGRLEPWTNKHLRLITTETGGYEWVDPNDPRVSEARLLQPVETVRDVDGTDERNLPPDRERAFHALATQPRTRSPLRPNCFASSLAFRALFLVTQRSAW